MRDLTKSDHNKLIINDARSGSEIELYYRNPTTEEEVAYQTKLFRRQGNKLIPQVFSTRLRFGLDILTGFREGDFGVDGKPISADPTSMNYREDWKALLKECAPDIITMFAFTIFEGARTGQMMDIEFEETQTAELIPPFPTS